MTNRLISLIRGAGLKTRLLNPLDEFWDRRFGVDTIGYLREVGDYDDPQWRAAYVPTHYRRIVAALRHVNIGPDDVVVDLGCGLGRAVFAASWLGARRAVGVEIDAALVDKARQSQRNSRLKDRDIEFVCAPAQAYSLDDVTVIYMFNPFGSGIMKEVIEHLEESLAKRPRNLRIVYENPLYSAPLDASRYLKHTESWPSGKAGSPHPLGFWKTV
ncbi:methyltransferase domain-containing protein [Sphaerotilaceae bacterium SBD11-9]